MTKLEERVEETNTLLCSMDKDIFTMTLLENQLEIMKSLIEIIDEKSSTQ